MDVLHHICCGIPCIHQHACERQFLSIQHVIEHLAHMIQLGLAIIIRRKNAVINHPELTQNRVHIHTIDNTNPFDETMCIPAVLLAYKIYLKAAIFVYDAIVKHQRV